LLISKYSFDNLPNVYRIIQLFLSHAEVISFNFSGAFNRVQAIDNVSAPDVQLGDKYTGQFTYDNAAPLFSSSDANTLLDIAKRRVTSG
jgi:hypothetical protein